MMQESDGAHGLLDAMSGHGHSHGPGSMGHGHSHGDMGHGQHASPEMMQMMASQLQMMAQSPGGEAMARMLQASGQSPDQPVDLQKILQMRQARMAQMMGEVQQAAGEGGGSGAAPGAASVADAADMQKLMEMRQAMITQRIAQAQQQAESGAASAPDAANLQQLMQMREDMITKRIAESQGQGQEGEGHSHSHNPDMLKFMQMRQALLQDSQSGGKQMAALQAAMAQAQQGPGSVDAAGMGAMMPFKPLPHMNPNYMYQDPLSSAGTLEPSWWWGGGHYTAPIFGWGDLAKRSQAEVEAVEGSQGGVNKCPNHGQSTSIPMPHELPTARPPLYCSLPLVGRLRFLRDTQGIIQFSIVWAYWIYGNYVGWNTILLPQYQEGRAHILLLIWFGALSVLCITSLMRASTLNPGRMSYSIDQTSLDHPDWTYCPICNSKRPPRAHHCRRCQQCVLKMDHHCPWINNCVGKENQFAFILLVLYAFLMSLTALVLSVLQLWYLPPCQDCDKTSFALAHQDGLLKTGVVLAILMMIFSCGLICGQHWSVHLDSYPIQHSHGLCIALMIMAILMMIFSTGLVCSQHWGVVLDVTTIEWMDIQRDMMAKGKLLPDKMPVNEQSMCQSYREMCGQRPVWMWLLPCRHNRRQIYAKAAAESV